MEEELVLKKVRSKLESEWPKLSQFIRVLEPHIQQIQDTTYLSYDQNLQLLILFEGNSQALQEKYFDNSEEYKKQAGILLTDQEQVIPKTAQECTWCLMDVTPEEGWHLECGHLLCKDCWAEYIVEQLKNKQPFPKCIREGCYLRVTQTFIKQVSDEKDNRIYQYYLNQLGRKMLDKSKKSVPCSYDCEYVYQPLHSIFEDKLVYDLECPRGHRFCYKCGSEPHRPLNCELVNKWNEKAGDGSMLDAFIKDNPNYFRCPKCSRVINYTQGCDQMTCGGLSGHGDLVKGQGCGHVFCWRCLQPWSEHKGGWSGCNQFKPKGKTEEERDNEKYMHYLQGYEDNRVMKMSNAQTVQTNIKGLCADDKDNYIKHFEKLNICQTQFQFVTDAVDFLVNARRTLKWTYVYGYYKIKDDQRELFEHQQGLFEEGVMKLQEFLIKDLKQLFSDQQKQNHEKEKEFYQKLKPQITSQHKSTEQFKDNLLKSLEQMDLGIEEYNKIKESEQITNQIIGQEEEEQYGDEDNYDDDDDEEEDEYDGEDYD